MPRLKYYRNDNNQQENRILVKALNTRRLRKLLVSRSDLIDFSDLSSKDRVVLLAIDYDFYSKQFSPATLNEGDKVDLVLTTPGKFMPFVNWQTVSAVNRSRVLFSRPLWAKKHNIPTAGINHLAWIAVIRKYPEYADRFLEEISLCRNKTELRKVFYTMPALVTRVTVEIIEDSVLTPKEWALLLNNRYVEQAKVEYTKEVSEFLANELLVGAIAGDYKSTGPLRKVKKLLDA